MPGQDRIGGLVDVGFLADVQHDRLGLAAAFDDLRHHGIQCIFAAPRDHDYPAVGGERLRTGLADAAAAAGHPGHAFPVV